MIRCFVTLLLATVLPSAADTPAGGIDCYCTDGSGARVDMGEIVCLDVDGRQFRARCEMSLNVPMWREIGGSCVAA